MKLKNFRSRTEPRTAAKTSFDEDGMIRNFRSPSNSTEFCSRCWCQIKDDYYEIIAGERRWRAAKLAGIKEVPVIIKDFTEQEVVEISLIENIQRESLNPIEEAMAYKRLMEEFHLLKQDEIADEFPRAELQLLIPCVF